MQVHADFECVSERYIESLGVRVVASKHSSTGALHYHLEHESEENSFLVAFRTQPTNSTGVAHVLEHTALCGSKKYPVRDPFFSMIKRSLQTFMNAFTASDWTAYPFATQNKTDFNNLLSVYLDAAFFPNLHELDFAQEGVRLAYTDQGRLEYRGIVFNEMKGAMSSEVSQLFEAMSEVLYPATTYHFNSGGDPKHIAELKHQDLTEFHAAHYHPSNAVFMSFGNKPLLELQTQLVELALSKFGKGITIKPVAEQRYSAPVQVTKSYAVDEQKPNQTHLLCGWLLPSMTEAKLKLSFELLEEVLLGHSGAPLREFLDQYPHAKGASRLLGLDDSRYEMAFYLGVQGSEDTHAEAFFNALNQRLVQLVETGFSAEATQGALHQMELRSRHVGGDGMPYGLTLLLEGLPNLIHLSDPEAEWDVSAEYAWLAEQVKNPEFLTGLIQTHLIDNPHCVQLTLSPDPELKTKLAEAEQHKLNLLEKSLTAEQKQQITELNKQLEHRQAQQDDLSLLPEVSLSDVAKQVSYDQAQTHELQLGNISTKAHWHEKGVSGLGYVHALFELPEQLFTHKRLSLAMSLIGELGTKTTPKGEFLEQLNLCSGGVGFGLSQRTSVDSADSFKAFANLSSYFLAKNTQAVSLMKQALLETDFNAPERILEVLRAKRSRAVASFVSSGHLVAMQLASAGFSKLSSLQFGLGGPHALVELNQLIQDLENQNGFDQLLSELEEAQQALVGLVPQFVGVSEAADTKDLLHALETEFQELPLEQALNPEAFELSAAPPEKDTAWMCATDVFHNAQAYKAVAAAHKDAPALMILAHYLRNNLLHRLIRESGGAYGGGCKFDANACAFVFYSYRDPRFEETFADFEKALSFMQDQAHEPHWLSEAVLGVVAQIDKPGSPAGEAISTSMLELHGRTAEFRSEFRAKLLEVKLTDLQRVAQTYLSSAPIKATVAPFKAEQRLKAAGFDVHKLSL